MRAKLIALGGVAVAGAAALYTGSQPWVRFMLDGTHDVETVTGHDVNPALSPVAIALIAAALALTIAGPVFRRVLGGLVSLLGAGLVGLTAGALVDPLSAAGGRITELTGLTGGAGAGVVWADVTGFAWGSAVAGLLGLVLGVLVIVTAPKWASGGRKYESGARQAATGPDRISDWDSLSGGDDPSDPTSSEDVPGDDIR